MMSMKFILHGSGVMSEQCGRSNNYQVKTIRIIIAATPDFHNIYIQKALKLCPPF